MSNVRKISDHPAYKPKPEKEARCGYCGNYGVVAVVTSFIGSVAPACDPCFRWLLYMSGQK